MQKDSELEYAGFWLRVWAAIIDTILMMVVIYPVLMAAYGSAYWSSEELLLGPVDLVMQWILPAVVVIVFWAAKGATPGKMAISARVVDARTGHKPSIAQLVGRYLAYIPASLPFALGLIWVGFDRRKQGWHDKLAGTVVVRNKAGHTQPVQFDGEHHTGEIHPDASR